MQMLDIKQLTRLQIIRYCEKLEKENKKLKERIEELEKICEWYEIENNIETMGNPIDPKILE